MDNVANGMYHYRLWLPFVHDPYLSDLNLVCVICMVCEQPAIDGQSIAVQTNKK